MVAGWIYGEKCVRCEKQRTKREVEGLPTCEACEQQMLNSARESKRRCPIDGSEMTKEVIYKVIIDRCPSCAGVWLDGGELDLVKKGIKAGAPDNFATGFMRGMAVG